MFQLLEESSYLLDGIESTEEYWKGGSFTPTKFFPNIDKQCRSFFVWRATADKISIDQIHSHKQLNLNSWNYNFTTDIVPSVQFIEYKDHQDYFILFYVVSQDTVIFRFRIPHPHGRWAMNDNPNDSVLRSLHSIDDPTLMCDRFRLQQFQTKADSNYDYLPIFTLLSPFAMIVALGTEIIFANVPLGAVEAGEWKLQSGTNGFFNKFIPGNDCCYECLEYLKIGAQRVLIAAVSREGYVDLFLVAGGRTVDRRSYSESQSTPNFRVLSKTRIKLPSSEDHDLSSANDNNSASGFGAAIGNRFGLGYTQKTEISDAHIVFATSAPLMRDRVRVSEMFVFFSQSNGESNQCVVASFEIGDSEFSTIPKFRKLPSLQNPTISAAFYDDTLWCITAPTNEDDSKIVNYEINYILVDNTLFSQLRHPKRQLNMNHWRWKRVYKRSEYINRSITNIKAELDFDLFHDTQLQPLIDSGIINDSSAESKPETESRPSWHFPHVSDTAIVDTMDAKRQSIHKIFFHHFVSMFLDDPVLELGPNALKSALNAWIRRNEVKVLSLGEIFNNTESVRNGVEFRSAVEKGLTEMMIKIMDSRVIEASGQQKITETQLKDKKYLQKIWDFYFHFFDDCLTFNVAQQQFIGFGRNDSSALVIKQNGFSVLREMDFSEVIGVFFEHAESQHQGLDISKSLPQQLVTLVEQCDTQNGESINRDVACWLVACCWFYCQTKKAFNNHLFQSQSAMLQDDFITQFRDYMRQRDAYESDESGDDMMSGTSPIGTIPDSLNMQIVQAWNAILDMTPLMDDMHRLFTDMQTSVALPSQSREFSTDSRAFPGFPASASLNPDQKEEADNDDLMGMNRRDVTTATQNNYFMDIWKDDSLMPCIESSFVSIVNARLFLLRSVIVTTLYSMHRNNEESSSYDKMGELVDVTRSYFILSVLSSDAYHQSNAADAMDGIESYVSDSLRPGSLMRHYLMSCVKQNQQIDEILNNPSREMTAILNSIFAARTITPQMDVPYLSNPQLFTVELINSFHVALNAQYSNHGRDISQSIQPPTNSRLLVYRVVHFMYSHRQFGALKSLLNHVHRYTPLFKYLLVQCHVEVAIDGSQRRPMDDPLLSDELMADYLSEALTYLSHTDTGDESRMRIDDSCAEERLLLHQLLSNQSQIAVNQMCELQMLQLPPRLDLLQQYREELSFLMRYRWALPLAFNFVILKVFSEKLIRPKLVVQFAKEGTSLLERALKRCRLIYRDDDVDMDTDNTTLAQRIQTVSGMESERIDRLYQFYSGNGEAILISFFKSNLLQSIMTESLKLDHYKEAYNCLRGFDDIIAVRLGVKQYVLSCCRDEKSEAILSQNWDFPIIAKQDFERLMPQSWADKLLQMQNQIESQQLTFHNLIESEIHSYASTVTTDTDLLVSFSYDTLWMFALQSQQYQSAARYQLEYVLRLEQHFSLKDDTIIALQMQLLCQMLHTFDLMSDNNQWIYLANNPLLSKGELIKDHSWLTAFQNGGTIITKKGVEMLYILIEAKQSLIALLCGDTDSLNIPIIGRMLPKDTANELIKRDSFNTALVLLMAFNCDCKDAFEKMTAQCLLNNSQWDELESALNKYDSVTTNFKYTLIAIDTILSYDNNTAIPAFINQRISSLMNKDRNGNDNYFDSSRRQQSYSELDCLLIPLLRLLCKFGRITDAVRLFIHCIAPMRSQPCYTDHSLWKVAQELVEYCRQRKLGDMEKSIFATLAEWIVPQHQQLIPNRS